MDDNLCGSFKELVLCFPKLRVKSVYVGTQVNKYDSVTV